jgi:hypothetical protein
MNETNNTDPGKGYRFLNYGETIKKGDELFDKSLKDGFLVSILLAKFLTLLVIHLNDDARSTKTIKS